MWSEATARSVPRLVAAGLGCALPASAGAQAFDDASAALLGVANHSVASGGSGYAGVGVLDYDGDGWLDLYFTDGPGHDNRLLRNDGAGGFVDVTVEAGVAVGTGSRGVLAADLDGNGATDLVLTGDLAAPLRVLANQGDGRFVDVSAGSGLTGASRNVSAHAADVDGDGWLDVYVAAGVLPNRSLVNTLYRNRGDGTLRFDEVGAASGVATAGGACAATFTHLDDDDAIDLVVANCGGDGGELLPFEVYRNDGHGTFTDLYAESRVWGLGHWMGLAFADFDGDGRLDFFATNSGIGRGQPHALYRADGDGTWSDVGPAMGVSDWEFGWGAVAGDVDDDGWPDLYYVGRSQVGDRYASPGNLFRNQGDGTFAPPSQPIDLSTSWTSGLAVGDLDNDGGVDFVVARTEVAVEGASGAAVYLRNAGGAGGAGRHWLTVRAHGAAPNLQAIGARVSVTGSGRVQVQQIDAGTSYQSTNSPWPTFGLADAADAELCVRWPDGVRESFGRVDANQRFDAVEGAGTPGDCGGTVSETGGPSDTASSGVPGPNVDRAGSGCGCGGGARLPGGAWLLAVGGAIGRGTGRGTRRARCTV